MRIIKLAGIEWQVLNEETGLIGTTGIVRTMYFGDDNKWSTSNIRKWLNEEFVKNFSVEELSYIQGEIRLLEESEINEIGVGERVKDMPYWLKTPYSSLSRHVRLVNADGSVYNTYAFHGLRGVVPALNLKAGILESVFEKD